MRILLVEDAEGLGEVIQDQIADEGHAIDWVQTIAHAEASLHTTRYDLILLDLMLPDGSGIDLLKELRHCGTTTPVIILTARDQISDRINGLNEGADDYLVKPFDLSELSARIAAVSRRYAGNPNPLLQVGTLQVDLTRHLVSRDGVSINLTAREWALLEAFIQRPGALLSKAQLEDHLYAFGAEIESNTIEVYISRLRKKLGRDQLETVRGLGYRMRR
ncbi:MAG: DNA-binding response regulator [Porticoccus sp.]|jgi:two-component system OmpR family response regulator|uniref:response regulator n=1 Tax=Porticoccus hydrocarbonoclasticus TaxID=1073414 RepID=UPI000C64643D|nr:response regulator transcription factor [Porticoccus hydrocarbonoclasticus]MBG58058.1 DNA-binding response regulator [Porticoccus sp.]|tara:strand:- start:2430 stop:3086 length:657 start_codon:yes stop_codon:yes gene_type:complete